MICLRMKRTNCIQFKAIISIKIFYKLRYHKFFKLGKIEEIQSHTYSIPASEVMHRLLQVALEASRFSFHLIVCGLDLHYDAFPLWGGTALFVADMRSATKPNSGSWEFSVSVTNNQFFISLMENIYLNRFQWGSGWFSWVLAAGFVHYVVVQKDCASR